MTEHARLPAVEPPKKIVEDSGITVIEKVPLGSIILVPHEHSIFRVKTHLVQLRVVLLYPTGFSNDCLQYPYGTHVRFVGNSTKGLVWDLLQHDTDRLAPPSKSEPT